MTIFLIFCLTFMVYFITILKKKYSYWRIRGVNGPNPIPIIGNLGNILFLRESIDVFTKRVYEEHPNEKIVGLFKGFSPVLLIRDPDLIKYMLISDSKYFLNRGTKTGETGLNNSLFFLEGESWRLLRKKITPLFTQNKLKGMLPLIQRSVDNFVKQIDLIIDSTDSCNVKALMAKYTADVVISCLFGFGADIYNGKVERLEEIGSQIFTPSLLTRLWYLVDMIIPGMHKIFQSIDPAFKIRNYFLNLVRHTVREREGKISNMTNFMDLMIELKQTNKASGYNHNNSQLEITDEVIAAEVYTFYGAGHHSSSLTMAFLAHELAFHQDVQDRLHKEICEAVKKHNGELNFESLKEMAYLQMVLYETLRKNTIIGWLIRKTEEDYVLPGINLRVEKGTTILISTAGIHSDSKYFQNPQEFNPENFSPKNKNNIPQCVYSPFGVGPRYCIGVRFAETQMMMAVAAFFMRFKVEPCKKTERHLRYDPKSFTLNTPSGIWLKILRR